MKSPSGLEHPDIRTPQGRINYILHLMSSVWNPSTSVHLKQELAEVWGCSLPSIHSYAASANRERLAPLRDNGATYAKRAFDALDEVLTADIRQPGIAAAKVAAAKTIFEFCGIEKPDEDKIQKFAAVESPDAARIALSRLFGKVTPGYDASSEAEAGAPAN